MIQDRKRCSRKTWALDLNLVFHILESISVSVSTNLFIFLFASFNISWLPHSTPVSILQIKQCPPDKCSVACYLPRQVKFMWQFCKCSPYICKTRSHNSCNKYHFSDFLHCGNRDSCLLTSLHEESQVLFLTFHCSTVWTS